MYAIIVSEVSIIAIYIGNCERLLLTLIYCWIINTCWQKLLYQPKQLHVHFCYIVRSKYHLSERIISTRLRDLDERKLNSTQTAELDTSFPACLTINFLIVTPGTSYANFDNCQV